MSSDTPYFSDDGPFHSTTPNLNGRDNTTMFMDMLVQRMGLRDENAADLYSFQQIISNGSPQAAQLFQMAIQLKLLQLMHAATADITTLNGTIAQIVDTLGSSVTSNKSLMPEINAATKAVVIEDKRIKFDNDSICRAIKNLLKTNPNFAALGALFDDNSTVSKRNFRHALGLGASYGKQHFRKHIKGSISKSLTVATRTAGQKMLGNDERVSAPMTLRMAHLGGALPVIPEFTLVYDLHLKSG
ncbi:hypothetical protein C8F01DRAFT_1252210 [Mycena amicta]|nr:hypothetical protein C8F01DRAFT_1252210 [Mycena amicta]